MTDGVGIEVKYDDGVLRAAAAGMKRLADSDAKGVEWGSNLVYAAIHQAGGTIHRKARSQSVFRKLSKKGEPSARFVKKKNANFEQAFHVGAHDIKIPARPYLGIDADDASEIGEICARHLKSAISGGEPGADPAFALYDAIGAAMVAKTELRFRQGVGPDGTPWKPSKRVLRKGGRTLVLSHHLLDSQTHNVLRGEE